MTQFPTTPRAALALLSLGGALVAAPASAARLDVSYSMNPPATAPGEGSELQNDIDTETAPFVELSSTYAYGIVQVTTLTGPEFYQTPDDPGIVVREFENAVIEDYDEANWLVSAYARAERDALRAQALWRQAQGFDGASVVAQAESRDVLSIGGGGGGLLTMDFILSGDVSAAVQPEFFGDDLDDVIQLEGVGFRFAAELGRGFDVTRVSDELKLGRNGIDVEGRNNALASMTNRVLTLEREVVAGEELDLWLYARAFVGTAIGRGRAYSDFGSTARLSSVSLTPGLTLSAESGFDYLALTGEAPEAPGTPGTGAAAVPLPAAGWLLAAGIGALAAARRRRR